LDVSTKVAVRVAQRVSRKIKSGDLGGKGVIDIGGNGALGRYKTWSLTSVKGHPLFCGF
jgi:hypothetical protein